MPTRPPECGMMRRPLLRTCSGHTCARNHMMGTVTTSLKYSTNKSRKGCLNKSLRSPGECTTLTAATTATLVPCHSSRRLPTPLCAAKRSASPSRRTWRSSFRGRCAAVRNVSSLSPATLSVDGCPVTEWTAAETGWRRRPHKAWRQEAHPPHVCELGRRLPHRRLRHPAFSMTIVTYGAHTLTLAEHVSPHLGSWQAPSAVATSVG